MQRTFAIGAILVIVYLLIVPAAFHGMLGYGFGYFFLEIPDPWVGAMLLCVHIYSSLRLAAATAAARPRVLQFTFWIAIYIWIVNVPSLQLASGLLPWGIPIAFPEYQWAVLIVIIGLSAYEIGRVSWKRPKQAIGHHDVTFTVPDIRPLWIVSVALVVAVGTYLGWETLVGSRSNFAEAADQTTLLVLRALLRSPVVVCFFAMLLLWLSGFHRRIRHFQWMFLAIALACLVANFPTAVLRMWLGMLVLGSLAIASIAKSRNFLGLFALPILFGLLFVFPLFSQFRFSTSLDFSRLGNSSAFTGGDFDMLQTHAMIVTGSDLSAPTPGYQLLGVLLFFVPRAIWPDKPTGTGHMIAEHWGMSFTNISAPLWSEAYVNFGLLGVVLAFFFYGRITSRLEYATLSRDAGVGILVFCAYLSGFQVFLLRGDLMTAYGLSLPVAIACYLGLRSRARSQSAAPNGLLWKA